MQALKQHEIPGRVSLFSGKGGLPAVRIETAWSLAEIYLHGAHVTRFQKTGEPPLLFLSEASQYDADKPIRGGVPLIYPWFGGRDGLPAHGTARITSWDLTETRVLPDGRVRLRFHLPSADGPEVDYVVTVGSSLTMEFTVANTGTADVTFENCLHSYFHVGDIRRIGITGLRGVAYFDCLLAATRTETAETLRIAGEVDRTYQNTAATVEIHDPVLGRTLRVRKSGSLSTVVWNPWIAKSQRMPDFGDNEYQTMVCVESGNIAEHAITLQPGIRHSLQVEVDDLPLDRGWD